MYYLPYNKDLKEFSRNLRSHSTLGEILLWNKLKAGQIMGYKFNRQKPLDNYIVDFYCSTLNLVIEIDGGSHNHEEAYIDDLERQKVLQQLGLNFLRFTEHEARKDMDNVIRAIESYVIAFEKDKV